MKPLLKLVLTLGAFFTSMLVLAKLTGVLDFAEIEATLESLRADGARWWVGAAVAAILCADLVIAVPTLELTVVAGHVLGFAAAFASTLLGVTAAGLAGYALSRWKGERVVRWILRDEHEREEMRATFRRHGVTMILLSRAVPVLPEVSACLSGVTGMPLRRFLIAWLAVNVPTMAIATYAGSISSFEDPYPAIAAVVGLSALFWSAWMLVRRRAAVSAATLGPASPTDTGRSGRG